MMNKRLFISHASEDKHPFVRGLAEALKANNLDVWYDEYEIKPGVSIRESVDLGLASCDAGLIILSPNYFAKKWTIWELNGFVQKMMSGTAKLIPVSFGIKHEDLLKISPALSDIFSLNSEDGAITIAQKVRELLYPDKPVLIKTREILNSFGLVSPDYYDNWWLDRIEFLGNDNVQYIPWSFPRNPQKSNLTTKADSLAWACMRYSWISIAEANDFNQFTDPNYIFEYISKTPGVLSACKVNLEYLALYAPQLLFFDSPLKREFEEIYNKSKLDMERTIFSPDFKCELTYNGEAPTCNLIFALLDMNFGKYTPSNLLRHFVEGERFGPRPSNKDYWDILIELLSEKSKTYPIQVVNVLIEGFRSQYSALQLKKVFVAKEPSSLERVFSTAELIQQAVEEIITDRKITISTSSNVIAERICDLHLTREDFTEKSFRLTIPSHELKYKFRGITFMQSE